MKQADLGLQTLTEDEYAKNGGKYVRKDENSYQRGADGRTWSQLVAKAKDKPEVILAQGHDGELIELFVKTEAVASAQQSGFTFRSAGGYSAKEKKRAQKKAALQLVAQAAVAQILPGLATTSEGLTEEVWPLLAQAAYAATDIERHAFLAKRRGLCQSQTAARDHIETWLKKKHPSLDYLHFIVELLLLAHPVEHFDPKWSDTFKAAAASWTSSSTFVHAARASGQSKFTRAALLWVRCARSSDSSRVA